MSTTLGRCNSLPSAPVCMETRRSRLSSGTKKTWVAGSSPATGPVRSEANRPNDDAKADPDITGTDARDPADVAGITDGLGAYDCSQIGYRDCRRLAVCVRDPQTGKVVGGLYGRSACGLVSVDGLLRPEDVRRARISSRVRAMAEEEGRRRGCTRLHAHRDDDAQRPGTRLLPEIGLRCRGDDRLRPARLHALFHDAEALRDPRPDPAVAPQPRGLDASPAEARREDVRRTRLYNKGILCLAVERKHTRPCGAAPPRERFGARRRDVRRHRIPRDRDLAVAAGRPRLLLSPGPPRGRWDRRLGIAVRLVSARHPVLDRLRLPAPAAGPLGNRSEPGRRAQSVTHSMDKGQVRDGL